MEVWVIQLLQVDSDNDFDDSLFQVPLHQLHQDPAFLLGRSRGGRGSSRRKPDADEQGGDLGQGRRRPRSGQRFEELLAQEQLRRKHGTAQDLQDSVT